MKIKKSNVYFSKTGTGTGAKLSLSLPFLRDIMGITEDDKKIKVVYDEWNKRIVIVKDNDDKPKTKTIDQLSEEALKKLRDLEYVKDYVNEIMVKTYGVEIGRKIFQEEISKALYNEIRAEGIFTEDEKKDIVLEYTKYANMDKVGEEILGEVVLFLSEVQELDTDSPKNYSHYLDTLYYKSLDMDIVYNRLKIEALGGAYVETGETELPCGLIDKLKEIYFIKNIRTFEVLVLRLFGTKYSKDHTSIDFGKLEKFKEELKKADLKSLPYDERMLGYQLLEEFEEAKKNMIVLYMSDLSDGLAEEVMRL